jgi:Ca2+-binding RTX toxin-like protein
LRLSALKAAEVRALRDGQDLVLEVKGAPNSSIRVQDQFLGELNQRLNSGGQVQSGLDLIVFADGMIWDRTRMALEVVDRERAAGNYNDPYLGSGSADVLWGGKGNDYLSGGVGGDIYVFERGDGQDVVNDLGTFSFGAIEAPTKGHQAFGNRNFAFSQQPIR